MAVKSDDCVMNVSSCTLNGSKNSGNCVDIELDPGAKLGNRDGSSLPAIRVECVQSYSVEWPERLG